MKITSFDDVAEFETAIAQFGGTREQWLDLSTGINPIPYPAPQLPADAWTKMPDQAAFKRLQGYARSFWNVPDGAAILPAAGTAAILAALPHLVTKGVAVRQEPPEDAQKADFIAAGWTVAQIEQHRMIAVHPNAPDVQIWSVDDLDEPFTIIDESYCDVAPNASLIRLSTRANTIVLKSFDTYWGLAGLRLGFAIGDPVIVEKLGALLGSWYLSGPSIMIGSEAMSDPAWANEARARLATDGRRLDAIMSKQGAPVIGGTALFRLYEVANAQAARDHLAKHKIWCKTYPYANNWLRLSLPASDRWAQLEAAF